MTLTARSVDMGIERWQTLPRKPADTVRFEDRGADTRHPVAVAWYSVTQQGAAPGLSTICQTQDTDGAAARSALHSSNLRLGGQETSKHERQTRYSLHRMAVGHVPVTAALLRPQAHPDRQTARAVHTDRSDRLCASALNPHGVLPHRRMCPSPAHSR